MTDQLARWTRAVLHLKAEEGDIVLSDLSDDDYDTETLAGIWLDSQSYRAAAGIVEKVLRAALAERLEEGIEVDGFYLWRGEVKRERCIDPDGFGAWLAGEIVDNPHALARYVNVNYIKKGGLPPAVRDTFFEKEATGTVEAQAIPKELLSNG